MPPATALRTSAPKHVPRVCVNISSPRVSMPLGLVIHVSEPRPLRLRPQLGASTSPPPGHNKMTGWHGPHLGTAPKDLFRLLGALSLFGRHLCSREARVLPQLPARSRAVTWSSVSIEAASRIRLLDPEPQTFLIYNRDGHFWLMPDEELEVSS